MPLDPYIFDATDVHVALFKRVLDIAIGDCMKQRGYVYSAASVEDSPASFPGDRPYGLWNVDRVRQYGSGVADSAVTKAFDADQAAGGPNWTQAQSECFSSIAVETKSKDGNSDVKFPSALRFLPTDADYGDSLGKRLAGEAADDARHDKRWNSVASSWDKCLEAKGLKAPKDVDDFSLLEGLASGSEQDIRVSLIVATCDQQSRRTQRLANIEAEYQESLIKQNEAALAPLARSISKRVSTAENYIAQHG